MSRWWYVLIGVLLVISTITTCVGMNQTVTLQSFDESQSESLDVLLNDQWPDQVWTKRCAIEVCV